MTASDLDAAITARTQERVSRQRALMEAQHEVAIDDWLLVLHPTVFAAMARHNLLGADETWIECPRCGGNAIGFPATRECREPHVESFVVPARLFGFRIVTDLGMPRHAIRLRREIEA